MGTALPVISLTVISLTALAEGDLESFQQLIQACEGIGFFYLTDLGISQSTLKQAAYTSRQFFGLPATVKSLFGHDAQTVFPRAARGYVALHGETFSIALPTKRPSIARSVTPGRNAASI